MYKKVGKYIIMMAVSLFFVGGMSSCKSDKEEEEDMNTSIVGKWQPAYEVFIEEFNGITLDKYDGPWDEEGDYFVEYKSDGTMTVYQDGEVTNGEWHLDGINLTVIGYDEEENPEPITRECKIKGNEMTTIEKYSEDGFKIYQEIRYKRVK